MELIWIKVDWYANVYVTCINHFCLTRFTILKAQKILHPEIPNHLLFKKKKYKERKWGKDVPSWKHFFLIQLMSKDNMPQHTARPILPTLLFSRVCLCQWIELVVFWNKLEATFLTKPFSFFFWILIPVLLPYCFCTGILRMLFEHFRLGRQIWAESTSYLTGICK